MSQDEQIQQRRLNFEALRALGVEQYPAPLRSRTHTVDALVREFGDRSGEELDAEPTTVTTAGPHPRRSARSARRTSWCSPTGSRRSRSTSAQDALPELDFKIFKLLDFGDWIGVEGALFRTKTQRADDLGVAAALSRQVPPAAAGEVARADRRRDPLPPALSRSDRQSRFAPRVRGAQPRGVGACASS